MSCELEILSDRVVMSLAAQDNVSAEVGEAFLVSMIGRSRSLTKDRWSRFTKSLARGVAPFVAADGGPGVVARLASWARGSLQPVDWSKLANLYWWYRNRRDDSELLDLLKRIRQVKGGLRRAGASWIDVARVSVCLKRRVGASDCACSMCRALRASGS